MVEVNKYVYDLYDFFVFQQNMGLISLLYFESKEHQPAPHSLIKKIDKVHGHSDS